MYMTINAKLCTCIGEYVKKKKILSQSNSLYIQVYILFNMKKKSSLESLYLFPFLLLIQFLLHGKLYLLKLTKSKTSWFFFFIAHIENKYKSAYVCTVSLQIKIVILIFFFLLWDEKYIHAWLGNEKLGQKNRFYSQIT